MSTYPTFLKDDNMATTSLLKKSMRVFGAPYQFTKQVDPRIPEISNWVGANYMNNIMLEAPIVTIIPGKPKYLPSEKKKANKISTTQALIQSASDGFSSLDQYLKKKNTDSLRIYDFERDYTNYMNYVNILCRAGASFLDLKEKIDGCYLQSYDWRNYRHTAKSYKDMIGGAINGVSDAVKKAFMTGSSKTDTSDPSKFKYETSSVKDKELSSLEENLTNYNFVQFYVDPDVSSNKSVTNQTSESQLKSMMDAGSGFTKDLAFMLNSGGVGQSGFDSLTTATADALDNVTNAFSKGGKITGTLSRVINLGGEVLKGNNIIMPDVYQSTSMNESYSLTCHLKTPYGTKLGYYLDIYVPMMHLLALAIPKQSTANTYSSPFMVKCYADGIFTCNMGIVDSISIQAVTESRSVDGLPTEVDVTLSITDLYSDLMLSPSTDPLLFINNSSLVEYLATLCGLSLVTPHLGKKLEFSLNTVKNSVTDIPSNINATIKENISNFISGYTGLTW